MKLYITLPLLTALAFLSTSCSDKPKAITQLPFTLVHDVDQWSYDALFDFEQDRFYDTGNCRFTNEDKQIDERLCARLFEFDSELGYSKPNHEFLHTAVDDWPIDYDLNWAALIQSGKKLLTFSYEGLVFVWNTETKDLEGVLKTNRDLKDIYQKGMFGYAVSSDNKHIATAMGNVNGLQIWNVDTLELTHTLSSTNGTSTFDSVEFSPDGRKIAAMQSNNTLGLWDVTTGKNLHVMGIENKDVGDSYRDLRFSPDGSYVLFRHLNNFEIWDVETGNQLSVIKLSRAFSADISPDGTKIVAAGGEPDAPRQISIYDAATGQSIVRLPVDSPKAGELGGFRNIDVLSFSPDGNYIVSSIDNILQFWDVNTGQLVYTGPKVSSDVYFKNDGSEMGIVDHDLRKVRVYDLVSTN